MSASHSTQPTNNNRQAQTYAAQYGRELLEHATEPDIDIGKSASFLKWKHWLALNGGWRTWATTTKLMRFVFSICFTKCFRNKSGSVFETKPNFFVNDDVFI